MTLTRTRMVHSRIQKSLRHCNSRNSEDGWREGVFCHSEWENTFLHENRYFVNLNDQRVFCQLDGKRCFVNLNDQRHPPPPTVFGLNLFCHVKARGGGGGGLLSLRLTKHLFSWKNVFSHSEWQKTPPSFPLSCFSWVGSVLNTFHPPSEHKGAQVFRPFASQ